jgi:hypothetical protein
MCGNCASGSSCAIAFPSDTHVLKVLRQRLGRRQPSGERLARATDVVQCAVRKPSPTLSRSSTPPVGRTLCLPHERRNLARPALFCTLWPSSPQNRSRSAMITPTGSTVPTMCLHTSYGQAGRDPCVNTRAAASARPLVTGPIPYRFRSLTGACHDAQ